MNNFENTDLIQWEKQEVTKASLLGQPVDYANPPKEFTLRGVRYIYLSIDRVYRGGPNDGREQYLACRADNPGGPSVWVSECFEGEIPFKGWGK